MPDYQKMYFELFRASEQAVRILIEAQRRAEEAYLAAPPPAVHLAETRDEETGEHGF